VLGNDFAPSSVVYLGGTPLATTFVHRGRLLATLPPALANRAGLFSLSVVTPGPAGGKSSSKPLTMLSPAAQIIDNRTKGFRSSGQWAASRGGYAKSILTSRSGDGTTKAQWAFANLTPGVYRISATWPGGRRSDAAGDAPFTIWAGKRRLGTVQVDQRRGPRGFKASGVSWQPLGTFTVSGGSIMVQLTAKASGAVLADAVRLDRVSVTPNLASGKRPHAASGAAVASPFSTTPIRTAAAQHAVAAPVAAAHSRPPFASAKALRRRPWLA